MTDRETMKLALEALERSMEAGVTGIKVDQAITALRQALEQPECNQHPDAPHGFNRASSHSLGRYVCDCEGWEPEPVAYVTGTSSGYFVVKPTDPSLVLPEKMALYSTPPKREWVGLTDEEIDYIWGVTKPDYEDMFDLPKAIEAKLREKNGF